MSINRTRGSTSVLRSRVLMGLAIFSLATMNGLGTAYGAMQVYIRWGKNDARSTLEQAEAWRQQRNYPLCIETARYVPQRSDRYDDAQLLIYRCDAALAKQNLEQAEALAAQDRLKDAIYLAREISPESFYYQRAQHAIETWSWQILTVAERHYLDPSGQLEMALSIARAVDEENSPIQAIAQDRIQQWQTTWEANQSHHRAAEIALGVGDWQTALASTQQISEHPYWNQQVDTLIQSANAQQQQQEFIWQSAHDALQERNWDEAGRLLSQLPETQTWAARKAEFREQMEIARTQQEDSDILWTQVLVGLFIVVVELLAVMGWRRRL